MYARTTTAHFKPGASREALSIFQNIMFPRAREQHGFKGALVLSDIPDDSGTIITFWESEADLLASAPPEDILPHVERLGELIAESSQHIYEVTFQI